MPILTGEITQHGAVLTVLVGVSENRRRALHSMGFAVPQSVSVRVLIDTGSHVTGMMQKVFAALQISAFKRDWVRTPSTSPESPWLCDFHDVGLSFVSGVDLHTWPSVHAIASDDFRPDEECQGIIGRDILDHCVFEYFGPSRRFRLSF